MKSKKLVVRPVVWRKSLQTMVTTIFLLLLCQCGPGRGWIDAYQIEVPRLEQPPRIDGDLSDWKEVAFHDGIWDVYRLQRTPWYDPSVNRLTDHGNEPSPEDDLSARYYLAWDEEYLYLGAEVRDNVNDVTDPNHEPKRWYFKDAVCWFIEAPRDDRSEAFGEGDHAFCFVIDTSKPPWGAWWRHGTARQTYVETPLPGDAVSYAVRMNPRGRSSGDFVLEARVRMAATFGVSDRDWHAPRIGDEYGLEIVHTDPDGGDYGGHFLIYGKGDDDLTWGKMKLVGSVKSLARKPQ